MSKISVILCYGVFVAPNLDYQKYFEDILADPNLNDADKIIVCGGISNKNYPELSEAKAAANLIDSLAPHLSPKVILEENSLSTPQNLDFALKYISENKLNPEHITIYCDSCRSPKVFYLTLSLLHPELTTEKEKLIIFGQTYLAASPDVSQEVDLSYQNFSIVGIPLSNSMEIIAHQIMSSMFEMHFFDYPDLHQQFIDYRKKKWGVK